MDPAIPADGAVDARDDLEPAAAAGRCPLCGGAHKPRQRCPGVTPSSSSSPPPAPAEIPAVAPGAAVIDAPPLVAITPTGVDALPPTAAAPVAVVAPTRRFTPAVVPTVPASGISISGGLRTLGAAGATLTLVVSLSVAGTYIARLAQVEPDPKKTLIWIACALGVGLAGMGLMFVAARVYAKVMFSLLAVVLITAGVMMMVFAPVLRQMNTPDLAEYRAFDALLGFGILSVAAGIVLGTMCVHWALRPVARVRLARWWRLLASVYGVMLGVSGISILYALFFLIRGHASTSSSGDEVSVVAQSIGIAFIAMWFLVPGLILTYHGISASMGEGSSEFRPPYAAVLAATFGGVLLVGHLNMSSGDPVAAPMPVLHVLAAVLPGLTYACLAWRGSLLRGQAVRWLTWRQATLAFGLSIGFSAMIAGNVNSLAGLAATVLLLVHNGAFKDALDSHDVFQRIGDAKVILSGNEQWAANLLAIAFAPPFIEEFLKGLSVRFVMRPNFTRAQAFATGAMAGAGFGFLEAMMYGLAGINHDLGSWWLIMLVRAGSTSTHVMNTALVGLAWWYWSIARRNRVAVGLFALAVLDHALWNGFSVTLYSQIWFLDTLSNHALEVAAYSIIAGWSCGIIFAIPSIARRLRDAAPPPVEGTPLASMAPWIA